MPSNKTNSLNYESLASSAKKGSVKSVARTPLKSSKKRNQSSDDSAPKNLTNRQKKIEENNIPSEQFSETQETVEAKNVVSAAENIHPAPETSYSTSLKQEKKVKKAENDRELLSSDRWLARNGHALTFVGIYLFSLLVLFRPYELTDSLLFLKATAFYFAAATLLLYLPTQVVTEGNLTIFSTEVKCILAMTFLALLTIPLGKDAAQSW